MDEMKFMMSLCCPELSIAGAVSESIKSLLQKMGRLIGEGMIVFSLVEETS